MKNIYIVIEHGTNYTVVFLGRKKPLSNELLD